MDPQIDWMESFVGFSLLLEGDGLLRILRDGDAPS